MSQSPRSYHHGDLRAALLVEGRRYLVEVGPEEVSLRELARRTGVSPRAPYRHFENREALLAALAAEGFQELLQDFAESDALPALERLQEMGRTYVDFARNNISVFQLMFSPLINHEFVAQLSAQAFEKLVAASHPLLPASAPFKEKITFATAIWSGLHGIATISMDGVGELYESDTFVTPDAIVTAICSGWGVGES